MPRGYRSVILLIVGCLISIIFSAGLAWGLYPEKIPLTGNTAIETVSTYDRETDRQCRPAQINLLAGPARQAKREACENTASERQQQRNAYIQARRSSDAADAPAAY